MTTINADIMEDNMFLQPEQNMESDIEAADVLGSFEAEIEQKNDYVTSRGCSRVFLNAGWRVFGCLEYMLSLLYVYT